MRWPFAYVTFIVLCCIAALLFVGCASMIPDPPAAPAIKCPALVAYPALEQQVLASELPKDGPETQIWIEDYIALRGACRK